MIREYKEEYLENLSKELQELILKRLEKYNQELAQWGRQRDFMKKNVILFEDAVLMDNNSFGWETVSSCTYFEFLLA